MQMNMCVKERTLQDDTQSKTKINYENKLPDCPQKCLRFKNFHIVTEKLLHGSEIIDSHNH